MRRAALLALFLLGPASGAEAPLTVEHRVTLASLFPANEATDLSKTLPVDRPIVFRVRWPRVGTANGVLVFVPSGDSGQLPDFWTPVLDAKHVAWIAADDFGNKKPTAQRVLTAIMAMKLAHTLGSVDAERRYIGGMSGGGRVASQTITRFPQQFAGAIFMSGADFWLPKHPALLEMVKSRRYVFLTGTYDFSNTEMNTVSRQYRKAGVSNLLFLEIENHKHRLATGEMLGKAIDFLDAR